MSLRLLVLFPVLVGVSCSAEDQPPWCQAQGELDSACAGPQCVAAVIIDYQRLEPRGYRLFALDGQPIDRAGAEVLAAEHVQKAFQAQAPDQVDSYATPDFFTCFLLYHTGDSWLVIVHAASGQVLFAGLEVWADEKQRGHDPRLPAGFLEPAALGCSDGAAEPEKKDLLNTGGPTSTAPASTAAEAWEVARRLNLMEQFTTEHSYRILVVSYAAVTGEFDPAAADWFVWVQRL